MSKYVIVIDENDSDITAVDISKKALNIAKKNAINNEVENQITFIESNLFERIRKEKVNKSMR